MSRKLSKKEKIFVPILILLLVAGSYVANFYFGYTNEQIIKFIIPLSFLVTAIERFLNKNKKIDENLELSKKERKSDSMLIWAAISGLFVIAFIGFSLHFINYLSKNGYEVSLTQLILILVVAPIVVFVLYLFKRAKIKKAA